MIKYYILSHTHKRPIINLLFVFAFNAAGLFAQGTDSREDELSRELMELIFTNDHAAAEAFGQRLFWGLIQEGMKESQNGATEAQQEPRVERAVFGSHRVTENLRIRQTPSLSAETIKVLTAGTRVQVLEISRQRMTIDGITAPWMRVKTEYGDTGWYFLGYLEKKVMFLNRGARKTFVLRAPNQTRFV